MPRNEYSERDDVLQTMGFGSYSSYLASPLWAGIRKRVQLRDRCRCRVCSNKSNQVHHESYDRETLGGVTLSRLYALCGDCHLKVEFERDGRKLSFREAQERLAKMLTGRTGRKQGKGRGKRRNKKSPRLGSPPRLRYSAPPSTKKVWKIFNVPAAAPSEMDLKRELSTKLHDEEMARRKIVKAMKHQMLLAADRRMAETRRAMSPQNYRQPARLEHSAA